LTLESIERRIDRHQVELEEPNLDELTQRVALGGLRLGVRLLRALDHALELVERPSDELGLGSLYLLTDFADQLIDVSVDLIESPTAAPDFAVRSYPLSRLIRNSSTESEPMPVELLYPRREASSTILVAPLLLHELGHAVCHQHDLLAALQTQLETREDWKENVAAHREAAGAAGDRPSLARTRDQFGSLLEECLCDTLATACLGPSYLLAFAAWAGLDTREEWAESHPPTYLRMAFMLEQLEGDGWDLKFMAGVGAWARGLQASLTKAPSHAPTKSAALIAAAPVFRAVVGDFLADREARLYPADYERQVSLGLEAAFVQDVLPAQLDHKGTWADRRCILLAAWKHGLLVDTGGHYDDKQLMHLREEDRQPAKLVGILTDVSFSAFLDKALEMSAVLERWQETAA
jgi:hypothetical protein